MKDEIATRDRYWCDPLPVRLGGLLCGAKFRRRSRPDRTVLDLWRAREFSPAHHVRKTLAATGRCAVGIAFWEPGQISPMHGHPEADEIYHVLEGEGLLRNGRTERRLGPGATVFFPAGEVHQVQSLTRMVLYRVQAGADRHPEFLEAWP